MISNVYRKPKKKSRWKHGGILGGRGIVEKKCKPAFESFKFSTFINMKLWLVPIV